MNNHVPEGSIIETEINGDNVVLYVGPFIELLNTYRVGVLEGPFQSGPCATDIVEKAYLNMTPTRRLQLKREHKRGK